MQAYIKINKSAIAMQSFSVKVSFLRNNAVLDINKFKYDLSRWKKLIARLKQENMDDAYL